MKRKFIFKLTILFFLIFILFSPISANASVSENNPVLEIGDILTCRTKMTNTDNWTVNILYIETYVSIDILKEDTKFSGEVIDSVYNSKIVYVQFSFKSSITTDSYRIDKFLIYSNLQYLENDSTTNVNWYEEEVVITQTKTNLSTISVYDRYSYRLLNYTSYDNEDRSFNIVLESIGNGIFGICPDGSNIISLYWNLGFSILFGIFILKMVPDKKFFKKIKIRSSLADSLWLSAIFVDINEITKSFRKEDRLTSSIHIELAIITSIGIISNTFYRIISFASDTYGVLQFWPLFWGFLVVEIVRVLLWIIPAILICTILQNKKLNPLKIEFFSVKTISRVFLYFYSSIMVLFFFSSWLLTFDRDRVEIRLPIHYYGSLTFDRIDPLINFIASIWNQMSWVLIFVWLIMIFYFIIRTFTKPTTNKLKVYTLKESNLIEKVISLSLLVFPIIWIINIVFVEFYIITELIYILMGI